MPKSSLRCVGTAAALAIAFSAVLVTPASAVTARNAVGGSGYGSSVRLGSLISDRTAYLPMCTTGRSFTGDGAAPALELGAAGTIGRATTLGTVRTSGTTKRAQSVTTTQASSLLGGLISFDRAAAAATATRTPAGYRNTTSVRFSGLVVGGVGQVARPAPNTKIKLPGVGSVLLNKQTRSTAFGDHRISATAMIINVRAGNPYGLSAGSMSISVATASAHSAVYRRPYGSAQGTSVRAPGAVLTEPGAPVFLPCGGSSGATITATAPAVDQPGVISSGAITTQGWTTDRPSRTTSHTRSRIAGVDLLGGVVTAKQIDVSAAATRRSRSQSTSSSGTKITKLKVNGRSVNVGNKENVRLDLVGVGTLWLRKTVRTGSSIQIYALQLELTAPRGTLPAGSVITVGAAKAGVS